MHISQYSSSRIAVAMLISAISIGASASDCPFADTMDMIKMKEMMGTTLTNQDKVAIIDKSLGVMQQEIKQKTVLDKPMTKTEIAACKQDIKVLKANRAALVASGSGRTAAKEESIAERACKLLYVGKPAGYKLEDGCVFDCVKLGTVVGIGNGMAAIKSNQTGNVREMPCTEVMIRDN